MWRYTSILIVLLAGLGQTYHIEEISGRIQRRPGDDVRMDCTVAGDDVDGFTTNIFWKKAQDTMEYREWTISQDGQAFQDSVFSKTGRFTVTILRLPVDSTYPDTGNNNYENYKDSDEYSDNYGTGYGGSYGAQPQQARVDYRVTLTIVDLRENDSGSYICEVGSQRLEYAVEVLVPVDTVSIYARKEAHGGGTVKDPGPVNLHWDKYGYLECIAGGGYPKPSLRIYAVDMHQANKLDLVDQFYVDANLTLKGSKPGLQEYYNYQRCYSDAFRLDPMYDGGEVVCEGYVQPNVTSKFAKIKVKLYSPPMAVDTFCEEIVGAELGDLNVEIKCRFKAKPHVSSVTWHINTTELNALKEEEAEGYATAFQAIGVNGHEVTLTIHNVTSESFRMYELHVQNDLGELPVSIELREGYDPSAGVTLNSSLLLLLLALAVVLVDVTSTCGL